DLSIAHGENVRQRGIFGPAELAIEIVSPRDESRAKLPFYAKVGVREVWLIDSRTQTLEIFHGTEPATESVLGLELIVAGDTLTIRDGDAVATVLINDSL